MEALTSLLLIPSELSRPRALDASARPLGPLHAYLVLYFYIEWMDVSTLDAKFDMDSHGGPWEPEKSRFLICINSQCIVPDVFFSETIIV